MIKFFYTILFSHLFLFCISQKLSVANYQFKFDSANIFSDAHTNDSTMYLKSITIKYKYEVTKDTVLKYIFESDEYKAYKLSGQLDVKWIANVNECYLITKNSKIKYNTFKLTLTNCYRGGYRKLKLKLKKGDIIIFQQELDNRGFIQMPNLNLAELSKSNILGVNVNLNLHAPNFTRYSFDIKNN